MRTRRGSGESRLVLVAGFLGIALAACGGSATSGTPRPDGSAVDASGRDAGRDGSRDSGSDGKRDVAVDAAPDGGPADAGRDVQEMSDATDAKAAMDAPPGPCGSRSGMRGLTHRTVEVGGLTRTYEVYLPSPADAKKPMPLVFVFHGFLMSGDQMRQITRYTDIADAEGVAVAFPDGEGGPSSLSAPWNVRGANQTVCGAGNIVSATGDDLTFVDAMKADVALDQCADEAHVFATGFSMGGYFTHHLACDRRDIRGVAPHSGGTLPDLSTCSPGHVPMILFHGKADGVIDDACDDPTVTPDVGFTASATLWAKKNGCKDTYTMLPSSTDAAATGQCLLYDGCPADGQVELCTFNAMGHCWAGGDPGDADVNACPAYAEATRLQWEFFKTYAW